MTPVAKLTREEGLSVCFLSIASTVASELNPEEMVNNDPIAKKLLVEFNGAPMANQNLTEDEARAVVEYFRTLN